MWTFSRPFDAITESDLRALITNNVREHVALEFKREPYGNSDGDRRKLLRAVAALANAEGGALIIGMDEDEKGAARELVPVPNPDLEHGRIITMCNESV